MYDVIQHVGHIRSSPKEKWVPNIDDVCVGVAKSHLSPQSVLMRQSYANVVSIPVKKHNRYIWHTSPLILQMTPTRLTLRGQRCIRYKNIFTSCGSDHKIFLGLHMP
jgi:hypothetical protein